MSTILSNNHKPRVSTKKKMAKDYQRVIDHIDMYADSFSHDIHGGHYEDNKNRISESKKKIINYDLLNGRVDTSLYGKGACVTIGKKKIPLEQYKLEHYPYISQMAAAKIGENYKKPYYLTVKDSSYFRSSFEEAETSRLLKMHYQVNVLGPMQQRLTEQTLAKYGIEDAFSLEPEQQDQIKAEVQQQITALNPEEIMEYMESDYSTPTARQGQEIMNFLEQKFNMKELANEGYVDAIAVAEKIYRVDVHDNELEYRGVNPVNFRSGGSASKVWVQKHTWAVERDFLTIEDATQKYAEYLKKSHYDILDRFVSPVFGSRYYEKLNNHQSTKRYMSEMAQNGDHYAEKYKNVDFKTSEGQRNIANIYRDVAAKYGIEGDFRSHLGIEELLVCYRDKRKLFKITRLEDNGEIKTYWVGETYKPSGKDIEVVEVWVDEIWQGVRLGGASDYIYLKLEPLKYQYRSFENPKDVELPYYGRKFNTYRNNSRNSSFVDLGKKYNKEIDIEMAALKHDLATNMGTMFVMFSEAKPDEMSEEEWLSLMKNFSLIKVDPKKHGLGGMDLSMIKSVNASKMGEIASRIQLIQTLIGELAKTMFSNSATLGNPGQYATNGNIASQQSASSNQTERFDDINREIDRVAAQAFLNKAKMFYKDNPEKLRRILSPSAYLELQEGAPFWYSELGIGVGNSNEDIRQIEALKENSKFFIQNSMSPMSVMELGAAKSTDQVQHIMKRAVKNLEKQNAQAQQFEMQKEQQKQDRIERIENLKYQFEFEKQARELASLEKRAAVQASVIERGVDVNNNSRHDLSEIKEKEMVSKEKIAADKLDLERFKVRSAAKQKINN